MYGLKNSLVCRLEKMYFLAWESSACKLPLLPSNELWTLFGKFKLAIFNLFFHIGYSGQ